MNALVAIARMRRHGIVNPVYTYRAAKEAGLELAIACAMLEQETGRGHNEWGHDQGTIFAGGYDALHRRAYGETVTRAGYVAYRLQRGSHGRGGMQGVGPTQLTYYTLQDRADKLGGCWKPYPNLRVGFSTLAANIRRAGLHAGVAAYNGTGPAAQRYADNVIAMSERWKRILGA